jgi:hypothetical protein
VSMLFSWCQYNHRLMDVVDAKSQHQVHRLDTLVDIPRVTFVTLSPDLIVLCTKFDCRAKLVATVTLNMRILAR